MNKLLAFCSMLLLCVTTSMAQNNVIDEVVWVVGDKAILKSEVEEARIRAQYEGRKFDGDPYCIIPEELAIQKLFLHQADLDSIQASESDVTSRVEMMMNQYIQSIGSKEKLEQYFNKPISKIRETMRENVREGLTVQQMKQEIIGEVTVTPAQVRDLVSEMPKDSIPFIPEMVEVQRITLQPKIPNKEIERVKSRLREFTERITSGESKFSTLALLYSEDPASARRGGELGFMGKGQLVPAYANVAFDLKDKNKVSKIVESEYGYHIIQLIERRGDMVNTRHILLKTKIAEADLTNALNQLDSIATEIRSDNIKFGRAALYFSSDVDTRNNHGLMPNPRTGTSLFEMQQLPDEIAKAVDRLKVGEVSNAFTMKNEKGKEICAIVKLKTKEIAHRASINEDYQVLKELVLKKLRAEKIEAWIKNKQKNTYVRVNKKWRMSGFKYPGWVKK
ncbi:MAG: peptidylprolyl isomerase [Bacteroidaceae bacterium]